MTFKTNVHTIHFRRKHESEAYKGHQVSLRLKKRVVRAAKTRAIWDLEIRN